MEGMRREMAEDRVKSVAGVPPFCKANMVKVHELDFKPPWVYASLRTLSSLLWPTEVPAHEYVPRLNGTRKNLRMPCWTSLPLL